MMSSTNHITDEAQIRYWKQEHDRIWRELMREKRINATLTRALKRAGAKGRQAKAEPEEIGLLFGPGPTN